MNRLLQFWILAIATVLATLGLATFAVAEQPLFVAYPTDGYETTAAHIFLIGTAPPTGTVTINGQPIDRSPAGHFAPTVSLQPGVNTFTLRYQNQELLIHVTRQITTPPVPVGITFVTTSLTPQVDLARQPGELICFEAIAPPQARVTVTLQDQTIPLLPQSGTTTLPDNAAVLIQQNQPIVTANAVHYQGCTSWTQPGQLGKPTYHLTLNGTTVEQTAPGSLEILGPTNSQVVAVTAAAGAARTGPSTDYSRLTPLPQGTRAAVTGREGDWLRLDYGAWIRAAETQPIANATPPQTLIRSLQARSVEGWTEVLFPLQTPIPLSVEQGDRTFTLTLYNATAQTDTIFLDDDPVIKRLDWQQPVPQRLQYTFHLKQDQSWGYKLRYDNSTLILSLRHPPQLTASPTRQSTLAGIRILLDPGHGGPEDLGARGPTGYPEKSATLITAKLLRDALRQRGATVYLTREADIDLSLQARIDQINRLEPAIALSLHYNALPDAGDAQHTAGVSAFWYNPQAHSLAMFLHHYLVDRDRRPSYGVFWNNLALTRPTVSPCVLLELGFMINPQEFEWITNPQAQHQLANTLADGIEAWLRSRST
jgi:N-acetylmuramoyl-L-alanine amidase